MKEWQKSFFSVSSDAQSQSHTGHKLGNIFFCENNYKLDPHDFKGEDLKLTILIKSIPYS